ncbi:acetyltransferase [Clostridia bacterium]|nr:acetyltransferase [Clostridia bacterium]
MREKLVIVGAGGHGRVVADIARLSSRYTQIVFADDIATGLFDGQEIVGTTAEVINDESVRNDSDVFIAVGNCSKRKKLTELFWRNGFCIATLIHPKSVIASNVVINEGTVVMANAVINSGSIIGRGVIVNTAATIDHDNEISDFVHISSGVHISGTVKIGSGTWVGVGTIVSNNQSICDDCIIGAGTVVVRDITEKGTYVGVPAKKIKDFEVAD